MATTEITPTPIERVRYNQMFRLTATAEKWDHYCLVDTHDATVSKSRGLAIKDTHGRVTRLTWGTVVYLFT